MSHRRIKTKTAKGPYDWIRTDDNSLEGFFKIAFMVRGLYPLLEHLEAACRKEAELSRTVKAQYHPGWVRNSEFCQQAADHISIAAQGLHQHWDSETPQVPAARRSDAPAGAMYAVADGEAFLYVKPHEETRES